MGINIEIKDSGTNVAHQRDLASRISDTACERIEQADTFFDVPHGQLKFPELAPNRGELIHCHRRAQSVPKRFDCSIVSTAEQ